MLLNILVLWLPLALSPQEDKTDRRIRQLIDTLRSEEIEKRADALEKLLSIGQAALPSLERAAKDRDPEVSGQAKRLIRTIRIGGRLTRRLKEAIPDAEDKIASGNPHAPTAVFLQAVSQVAGGSPAYGHLKREDLEPLAADALRGAVTVEDKGRVAYEVGNRKLRAAIPELRTLLYDPDEGVFEISVRALIELGDEGCASVLLKLLRHLEVQYRRRAVTALKNVGASSTIPELLERLDDPDLEVRCLSIDALSTMGSRRSVPRLIDLLDDDEAEIRMRALIALTTFKARDAIPGALRCLGDPAPKVRVQAARLLSWLRAMEAGPRLVPLLEDEDGSVRAEALKAVAWLGAPLEGSVVRHMLRDLDPDVRLSALRALGSTGKRGSLGDVSGLLDDPHPKVRGAAVAALGRLGGKERIPEIRRFLKDKSPIVQRNALWALQGLGAVEAALDILPFLDSKDEGIRRNALQVLAGMKAKKAAPALVEILKEDRGNGYHVVSALVAIGDPAIADDVRPLLKHQKQYMRKYALQILSAIGGKKEIPTYTALLGDPHPEIRRLASDLLEKFGGREAVPRLVALLKHEKRDVRWTAIHRLASFDPVEARAQMPPLLADPDPWARKLAVGVLGGGESQSFLPKILPLLEDSDRRVRREVLDTIVKWKATEMIPTIQGLLDDEAENVRARAAYVLGEWGAKSAVGDLRLRLEDPDEADDVRWEAAEALVRLLGPDSAPELARRIPVGEGSDLVRNAKSIPEPFRKVLADRVIPLLAELLSHEDTSVRERALQDMIWWGSDVALQHFISALDDPASRVRHTALEGLWHLRPKGHAPRIRELLNDSETTVRFQAARVLGEWGMREAIPDIIRILRELDDTSPYPPPFSALVKLEAKEAVPEILPFLVNDELFVATEPLRGLVGLADPEWVPRIVPLLKDRRSAARRGAIYALGYLGAREAVPHIRPLLSDWNDGVRACAAEALVDLGAVEAVPDLIPLIEDPYPEVRKRAVTAIRDLGTPEHWAEVARRARDVGSEAYKRAAEDLPGNGGPEEIRSLLSGELSLAGVERLRELDARETAPRIARFMRQSKGYPRISAAGCLAEWGVWEGAEALMEEAGWAWNPLNAMRRPEVWKRLKEKKLTRDLGGNARELWSAIAKEAGLTLELPRELHESQDLEMRRVQRIRHRSGRTSLLDALEAVSPEWGGYVLERDKLRILDYKEKAEFWRAWRSGVQSRIEAEEKE